MKRIRIVGLALVAVFALSVLASSATAAPVYYTKVEYGATANTPIKFTGTLGAAFLEGQVSKTKIECVKGEATGEVTGPTTTKKNDTLFKECQTGGIPCKNQGTNEIKTKLLQSELGDVKTGIPGSRLFDEAGGKGAVLTEFECGGLPVKVKGSVIGQLSGAAGNTVKEGKFASSNKLTFAEAAGVQKFSKFLGEAGSEQLESKAGAGEYEKGGQSVIVTLKAEGVSNLGFTK
jgi:hypothetical protein